MATTPGRKRAIFAPRARAPSASSAGPSSSALAVALSTRLVMPTPRREVALHGDAAQAGVDADEQQPNALGDQVRQGGPGERLQFGAGEADVPGWPQAGSSSPCANPCASPARVLREPATGGTLTT